MPPAKKDPPTAAATAQAQQDAASDGLDYYELPKALVQRIAKSSIPESSKLQKETVTALQKGSTVFINYLAATAHDIATSRQHKSVSASDVLKALEVIQFGDMVEPLQHELQIFRENAKNPKKSSGGASKSAASANAGASATESASARSKLSNASAKGKGKERAAGAGHGPSPLSTSVSAADAGTGTDADMGEAADAEGAGEPEDDSAEEEEEEGEGAEDEEDELADDVDVEDDIEEEGDEPEELVDRMAVDEEEIKQDAKAADLGAVDGGE